MKQRIFGLFVVAGAMLLTVGCKSLFPSKSSTVESQWKSYADVESTFEKITPGQTDTNGLKLLGIDPSLSPNVKTLTYVDIVQYFMPQPGVRLRDLPDAVRECIEARERSWAYQIDLQALHSRRYGNLVLDVFGFKRKTHEDGWRFQGIILIKQGMVVYKLSSGEPHISRNEQQVHPLGPLQELDGSLLHVVSIPK